MKFHLFVSKENIPQFQKDLQNKTEIQKPFLPQKRQKTRIESDPEEPRNEDRHKNREKKHATDDRGRENKRELPFLLSATNRRRMEGGKAFSRGGGFSRWEAREAKSLALVCA